MIEFQRKYFIEGKRVDKKEVVYTEEECDTQGISYKYWKDITQKDIGKVLALSDDGYCGRVIKVKEYIKGKKRYKLVKLSYGVSFVKKESKILFEENYKYNCYSEIKPAYWLDKEARKERMKRFAYLLALMKLNGKIDWDKLGKSYRPDWKYPAISAKILATKKRVKEMVDEEIRKLLKLQGIDEEWIIVKTKKAMKIAEDNGEVANMMKVIDKTSKWLGMDGNVVKETQTLELEEKKLLEDKIQQQKKIKMQRELEGENLLEDNNESEKDRKTSKEGEL